MVGMELPQVYLVGKQQLASRNIVRWIPYYLVTVLALYLLVESFSLRDWNGVRAGIHKQFFKSS
jgi:hypothetical protein